MTDEELCEARQDGREIIFRVSRWLGLVALRFCNPEPSSGATGVFSQWKDKQDG